MSPKKWLVLGALALANVLVLGALAVVVLRSLMSPPVASAPTLTPVASPQPTPTSRPSRTPTPTRTPRPSRTPRPTGLSTETLTPWPTLTPTVPPTPAPVSLENPTFEGILENSIPGWQTGAFVNWAGEGDFDAANSYAVPRFHQADDPRQWINGPTLQVDTVPWVKLRAWVYQTVNVYPGSRVQFSVRAFGFVADTSTRYILKAGLDPNGGDGCEAVQWGTERLVNQDDGTVELVSPELVVGQAGRATVCISAETQFAQVYHAAFFDDAALTALPPAGP
jgi:hypothetical protein